MLVFQNEINTKYFFLAALALTQLLLFIILGLYVALFFPCTQNTPFLLPLRQSFNSNFCIRKSMGEVLGTKQKAQAKGKGQKFVLFGLSFLPALNIR